VQHDSQSSLTSYHTIQDDIRNAGGNRIDRETAEDDNWVSSRGPDDIPAFNRAMINLFSRSREQVGEGLTSSHLEGAYRTS
jgi:putative intracellular protease/amidase